MSFSFFIWWYFYWSAYYSQWDYSFCVFASGSFTFSATDVLLKSSSLHSYLYKNDDFGHVPSLNVLIITCLLLYNFSTLFLTNSFFIVLPLLASFLLINDNSSKSSCFLSAASKEKISFKITWKSSINDLNLLKLKTVLSPTKYIKFLHSIFFPPL